jgi:hypothetical protein
MNTLNPAIPPDGSLFQPVIGPRGLRLALVFGNEAPHGRCPYYLTQCTHCDLGDGEGCRFSFDLNMERLAFFREQYREIWPEVRHLIIYNSGSTLDPLEMSLETLDGILEFARSLPGCPRVSLDSREDFVTVERVRFVLDRLRPEQTLCLTLGLESQNDEIRIKHLAKTITRDEVEAIFRILSQWRERSCVEINMVFQPPGTVGEDAVREAVATVEYGVELRDRHQVNVDFNYHPYYPTWKGVSEYPNHPRAVLEDGIKALIGMVRFLRNHPGNTRVFVGWNDEGHDLQISSKHRELLLYSPGIQRFNQTQNEEDLRI